MAGFGGLGFPLKIAGNPGVFLAVSVGTQWETRGKTQRYTLKTKTSPQKKVLSLVLCVAMLLSVMVMGTGAAFTDQDEIQNAEAVDMTSALGIIDGYEDGSFQPAENIERGEAAKMISAMLNGGRDSVQETTESSYNDVLGSVDAWANKYIEYCTARGIVSGVGGDRFAPASNVTGTQLAKMLLVSLGYDSVKEGYQDNAMWSVNVNTDAVAAGLYAGIETIDMSAPLSRDNAAQMIWNALQANTVYYLTNISDATVTDTTLLETAFGSEYGVDTGVMAQIYYNKGSKAEYTYSIVDVNTDRTDIVNVIGGDLPANAETYNTTADYSDLFGMNVSVLYKGDEALCIRVNEGGVVVEGVWGDIGGANANGNTFTVNGQKYYLDNVVGDQGILNLVNVVIPFNGFDDYYKLIQLWKDDTIPFLAPEDQYSFRAIDLDGDTRVDLFVFYPYVVLNVDDVDDDDFTTSIIGSDDAKLFVDPDMQEDAFVGDRDPWGVNLVGNIEYDDVQVNGDLARYGYVKAVPATFTAQGEDSYTALEIKTATPSALSRQDELITLNGTQYTGELLTDSTLTNIDVFADISLKHSYSYVEVNGYLFVMDGAGVQAPTNYTVVTDVAANTTGTTAKVYSTDLLLSNGETVTVDAKVTLDSATPAITATTPVVGVMYTYDIDNAGNYILTRVKSSASYADNDSIYDVQQAYKTGARLAAEGIYNGGVTGIYATDVAGGYFFNNTDNTIKYYVEDDAAIFVYYTEDDTYDVITGEELMDNDDSGVAWAFTGASEKSNGFTTVDLGYVALGHDIDEVTYDAYVLSAPTRVMTDDNGDFYVTIEVLLSDGSTKTLESKHVDLYEDAQLLRDLYAANPDAIYELTVLDGVIVHETMLVDMTAVTVDATYDKDGSKFMANGVTYVIDEDTLVYSLDGHPLTAITKDDTVWVPTAVAGASAGAVVTLTHLVYDD